MKLFIYSLLCATMLTTALCDEQLQLVIEVARHGARSPTAILPLNSTSVNFNDTLALLQVGWEQHQTKGKLLRDKYVTEARFLPADYNSSQVFVQATSSSRTQVSAQA